MKYFSSIDDLLFYQSPIVFDKKTPKNILKYAIGANMYMPGTQSNLFEKLVGNKFREIGAITLCLEDAIPEKDLEKAEDNILYLLDSLSSKCKTSENSFTDQLPLLFIRVRNPEQFERFAKKLTKQHLSFLCGFNFPKFNSLNGNLYFQTLKKLSGKHDEILYGMPILEDERIIYKETRFSELEKIEEIFSRYDDYVLNLRIGGTDFSSFFGLRRSVNNTIYDIRVVADCFIDILNFFMRKSREYVISGPVWEYFSNDENSPEIKGLVKELKLDMENGFHGKTIIHPSQINVVNKQYPVCYSDYMDAKDILNSDGGVFKGLDGNRMNEAVPHRNWAEKIMARAEIFGVLDDKSHL